MVSKSSYSAKVRGHRSISLLNSPFVRFLCLIFSFTLIFYISKTDSFLVHGRTVFQHQTLVLKIHLSRLCVFSFLVHLSHISPVWRETDRSASLFLSRWFTSERWRTQQKQKHLRRHPHQHRLGTQNHSGNRIGWRHMMTLLTKPRLDAAQKRAGRSVVLNAMLFDSAIGWWISFACIVSRNCVWHCRVLFVSVVCLPGVCNGDFNCWFYRLPGVVCWLLRALQTKVVKMCPQHELGKHRDGYFLRNLGSCGTTPFVAGQFEQQRLMRWRKQACDWKWRVLYYHLIFSYSPKQIASSRTRRPFCATYSLGIGWR